MSRIIYVGGAIQVPKEVEKSQPGEYEAFVSQKVIKYADFLHNPYMESRYVVVAPLIPVALIT